MAEKVPFTLGAKSNPMPKDPTARDRVDTTPVTAATAPASPYVRNRSKHLENFEKARAVASDPSAEKPIKAGE